MGEGDPERVFVGGDEVFAARRSWRRRRRGVPYGTVNVGRDSAAVGSGAAPKRDLCAWVYGQAMYIGPQARRMCCSVVKREEWVASLREGRTISVLKLWYQTPATEEEDK